MPESGVRLPCVSSHLLIPHCYKVGPTATPSHRWDIKAQTNQGHLSTVTHGVNDRAEIQSGCVCPHIPGNWHGGCFSPGDIHSLLSWLVPLFLAVLTSTLESQFSFVNTRNQFWLFWQERGLFRGYEVAHEIARNVKNQAWKTSRNAGRPVIHQVRTPMLSLHHWTLCCYWKLDAVATAWDESSFPASLHCLFGIPSHSGNMWLAEHHSLCPTLTSSGWSGPLE